MVIGRLRNHSKKVDVQEIKELEEQPEVKPYQIKTDDLNLLEQRIIKLEGRE